MPSLAALILPVVVVASSLASGTGERQPGLLVSLYDIGHGMHAIPELVPNQSPNVIKIIPTLELRTKRGDFAPFEGNFYTEVTGFLTVDQFGKYAFRLISDDGAILWIDEKLVINHDGLHGAVPKDGDILLTAGEHGLRVVHFESGGDEHLELQWRQPDADDAKFALIPAAALTYDNAVSRETSPGKKRIIPPLRRGLPGDGTPVAGMHPSFVIKSGRSTGISHPELSAQTMRVIGEPLPPAGTRPYVWLPQSEGQKPPGEYWKFQDTSYEGHFLVGIGNSGHRVVIETLEDIKQGCVHRFSSGRLDVFSHPASTREQTFEMLAVRAMTNGFEIEFTKPLDPRCGWEPESYYIEQWPFNLKSEISDSTSEPETQARAKSEPEAQARVHPPRRDGVRYPVKSASVSPDRKKVFLEIENLKPSHVVYIRLLPPCYSVGGDRPWSTEAWYTLNVIPWNLYGKVQTPPEPEPRNYLTAEEKAAGWRLLFDGQTAAGWRGYKKDHFPDGWIVKDGCLVRVGPGGDIATRDEFDNFELSLEWRIAAAGNSGIFYRVNERFGWPWESGPEMQVLDNAEHADGRNPKTSAGSNYALHAPVRDATHPIGFFNKVRIVADGSHVEYWLNGVKVVEYELWSDEWKKLVADSKFKKWPNYGLVKKGRIVLQDHGDEVWYRNIKIRPLGGNKVTR